MKLIVAGLLLALAGCSTYSAKDRTLVCMGFCALHGVEVVQHDGSRVLVPATQPSCQATK